MIQHVSLETKREDSPAEAAFWRLLGFEPVDPPPSLAERADWFERDGTQIHLLWHDSPTAAPEGHVAVVLDDGYETVLTTLREAGFEAEPRTEHWGSPRCFVRSPGGHRVELMEFAPA